MHAVEVITYDLTYSILLLATALNRRESSLRRGEIEKTHTRYDRETNPLSTFVQILRICNKRPLAATQPNQANLPPNPPGVPLTHPLMHDISREAEE